MSLMRIRIIGLRRFGLVLALGQREGKVEAWTVAMSVEGPVCVG